MRYVKLGVTLFSFLAITAFVWASESDELREKAKAMQREAAELAERGRREEAVNLKQTCFPAANVAKLDSYFSSGPNPNRLVARFGRGLFLMLDQTDNSLSSRLGKE